jgi:hypothetical protein
MAGTTACRRRGGGDPRRLAGGAAGGRSRPARARAALADRTLARWLASELLANAAWAGTLVYTGTRFAESYGTSTTLTGYLLAVAAVAYVAGNLICPRLVRRDPRRVLVLLAVLLALTDGLFGSARPGIAASTALLACAAFVAGGRTLVASAFTLGTAPEFRPAVTGLRAATMQFGYFAGSIAGGAALAVGGYSALGDTMSALFLGAAATSPASRPRRARPPSAAPRSATRVRCYRLFTGRGGEQQPARGPLRPFRNVQHQGTRDEPSRPPHAHPDPPAAPMNPPSSGNPLWQEHLERLRRLHGQSSPRTRHTGTRRISMSDRDVEKARHGEWTATPPGRLGRRLLADIESYLEFFAIASAD